MTQDKQLHRVSLDRVVEKRRLGQALNAKEFAVLAGISYSAAREWFRLPGFPVFRGFVFWQDFTDWRRASARVNEGSVESTPAVGVLSDSINARDLRGEGRADTSGGVRRARLRSGSIP
jgi:hypothetical protein